MNSHLECLNESIAQMSSFICLAGKMFFNQPSTRIDPVFQDAVDLFMGTLTAHIRGVNIRFEGRMRNWGTVLLLTAQIQWGDDLVTIHHESENLDKLTREQIKQKAVLTATLMAQGFGERVFLSPIGDSAESQERRQ